MSALSTKVKIYLERNCAHPIAREIIHWGGLNEL